MEADRRKNEFLAMLSHELRNPLAPILNSLYVLRQSEGDDPVVVQSRSMIERQVAHLKQLVDDLIDVARVTSGKIQLRKERVKLGDVVSRAVEDVAPKVAERQHTLTTEAAPVPLWLEADPTRLEQVFTNLLTNAAKYTEPGGQLWLNIGASTTRLRSGSATTASASIRRSCLGSSTCSRRPITRSTGPRAAWASG